MRAFVFSMLALGAVFGALRIMHGYFVSVATKDGSQCLALEGSTTTDEGSLHYIVGTVRNNCDRKMPTVIVSFQVGDDNRGQGTAQLITAAAHNLEPGGAASIRSSGYSGDSSYRLSRIRGF